MAHLKYKVGDIVLVKTLRRSGHRLSSIPIIDTETRTWITSIKEFGDTSKGHKPIYLLGFSERFGRKDINPATAVQKLKYKLMHTTCVPLADL